MKENEALKVQLAKPSFSTRIYTKGTEWIKDHPKLIIGSAVGISLVGGGIYLWKRLERERQEREQLERQLSDLQQQVAQIIQPTNFPPKS